MSIGLSQADKGRSTTGWKMVLPWWDMGDKSICSMETHDDDERGDVGYRI